MSFALLCPGQGAQQSGLLDIAARSRAAAEILDSAAAALGDDPRAWVADPDLLFDNAHAQPLICISQLAWWAALRDALPLPAGIAGYSVGELAAYAVADALDSAALARLARERACLMDSASAREPGGMIALRGVSRAAAADLCAGRQAYVAIVIDDDACVIGGSQPAIAAVDTAARQSGAQVTCLRVGVASHTPLLAGAVEPFRALLDASPLTAPRRPVVAGIDGSWVLTRERAIEVLPAQIARTVEWSRCMDALYERGARVFLELGPGTALSRMVRSRLGDVEARAVDEFREPGAVAEWVARCVARARSAD
jgi:[acyl-carrier-protein] S-malonyltransferase